MTRAYRVTIEAIDGKGTVDHRVEVLEPFEEGRGDPSHALGIALAGAIDGMCVFDEPYNSSVVTTLLGRMDLDCPILNAVAYARRRWLDLIGKTEDDCEFEEVAALVVKKDFLGDPLYGISVDALPIADDS